MSYFKWQQVDQRQIVSNSILFLTCSVIFLNLAQGSSSSAAFSSTFCGGALLSSISEGFSFLSSRGDGCVGGLEGEGAGGREGGALGLEGGELVTKMIA